MNCTRYSGKIIHIINLNFLYYRSISGITKSREDIIATRSAILCPLDILSRTERFENPGDLNFNLYGSFLPSLTMKTPNSPRAVSTF